MGRCRVSTASREASGRQVLSSGAPRGKAWALPFSNANLRFPWSQRPRAFRTLFLAPESRFRIVSLVVVQESRPEPVRGPRRHP
jgi:hypothetical protein